MIRCMLQLFFSQSLGQKCSVELLALLPNTIKIVLTITVLMITVLEPVRSYGSVILMMTILALGCVRWRRGCCYGQISCHSFVVLTSDHERIFLEYSHSQRLLSSLLPSRLSELYVSASSSGVNRIYFCVL